jgi:hypothetical protein
MDKSQIKIKLRESIVDILKSNKPVEEQQIDEKHHDATKSNRDNDHDISNLNNQKKGGDTGKKDYSDVKREFEKLGGPSMVDVMKLIGIKDDEKAVNRSLFRKKVKQIKNPDTGSIYQFDEKELSQVRSALDIKK